MEITEKHIKVLLSYQKIAEGSDVVINKADREECYNFGLIDRETN